MNTELRKMILKVIECSELEKNINTSEPTPVFSYKICTPKFTLEISRQGNQYKVTVNDECLLKTTVTNIRTAAHLMALEIWAAARNKYEQQTQQNLSTQNTLNLLKDYVVAQKREMMMNHNKTL